jgi:hypothetical protein
LSIVLLSVPAEMAELADALVSGISDRKVMQVQVLFSAPQTKKNRFAVLFNRVGGR